MALKLVVVGAAVTAALLLPPCAVTMTVGVSIKTSGWSVLVLYARVVRLSVVYRSGLPHKPFLDFLL